MFSSITFLEFVLLLGVMTIVAIIANFLRLPMIVAFIISGMAAGPYGLKLIESLPDVGLLAEISAIFLMFTIGLEFSFKKLKALQREFLKLGSFQVLVTITCISLLSQLILKVSFPKSLFFGFLVALSSTALVLKVLYEQREMETLYGRNSTGILLFQDVAVIPMMLSLPLFAHGIMDFKNPVEFLALDWLLKALGTILAILIAGRYGIPYLMEKVAKIGSREVFFFFVLFSCLGTAYIFHSFGLSLSLGAFVAGMLISESPYGRQATSDILPLRDNFLSLLFATIGMMLDMGFLLENIGSIVCMGTIIFMIKFFVTLSACLLWKTPTKFAIISALTVCQIGEFSFILASHGLKLELLSNLEQQYFLSISILSMLITPFLLMLGPKLTLSRSDKWTSLVATDEISNSLHEKNASSSKEIEKSQERISEDPSHAILIGFGIANQNLAGAFDALDVPYNIIEANYNTVKKFRKQGYSIDFGDATSHEVLKHAKVESANLVIIAISGAKVIPAIINSIKYMRPDVQIIVRVQYIRDIEGFKYFENVDIAVAEIETSVELVSRSLKVYGVRADDIHNYMAQAKKQLMTFSNITSRLDGPALNLPSWEALSSIRPLRISEDFACLNKALFELDLVRKTGVSVASVFRPGKGMTIPGGDYVLSCGDVIHMVGSKKSLKEAVSELRGY